MRDNGSKFKRRLVAVLYADVVGYTRLTGQDETGTHLELRKTLDVLTECVERHEGTVVHFAGDAVLAKFDTVTAALACAVETQENLSALHEHIPDQQRVAVRIGVNLGDVIIDRDDIYGDGVNIAVRIQELAEPGGISISDNVRDAVSASFPATYEYMGEQRVKNVDHPIRTFRVLTGSGRKAVRVATTTSKPSIAVLPFEQFGDNHEGFSEGVTEDVIRQLSRFRGLSVITHHSSFLYRNKAVKVQQVGNQLGVGYIVEGTVRRAASRVRITAQLIEADTGQHLWGDCYDREDGDILDLQSDVARSICAALGGRLRVAAQQRAVRRPLDYLDVYDYVLRGQAHTGNSPEDNRQAQAAFQKAIRLDRGCARAYSGLAVTYLSEFLNDWVDGTASVLGAGVENANKAIDRDDADSKPYWVLGELKLFCGDVESALMHLEKAVDLNPNDTDVYAARGVVLTYASKPERAIKDLELAIALNPYHPAWYLWALGLALFLKGNYGEAVNPLRNAIERKPDFFTPYVHLTAVFSRIAKDGRARESARQARQKNPKICLKTVRRLHPFQHAGDMENYLQALRDGGFADD